MFQSFKKWVKNEEVQQRPAPPAGMQLMKGDLQRKFAKGVQYNMKIVIKGDRNTGKTCLLHRLKGHKFLEEYIPTAEIQVASIHWDYKATDDIVKVDVWDVVDQGKSNKNESKGLKIANDSPKQALEEQLLDATFLDVYKHTHAVILIFDITKKWTFSYIERELPKVPTHIPVLILANFRDMGDHRVITVDQVKGLVESTDRPPGSPSVMFCESSMKHGFGLRYIHKFFNMPFLLVQRESLLKQLETNHLDLESCVEELSTEEHSYEVFIESRRNPRKNVPAQPQLGPVRTPEPAENKKTEPTKAPQRNNSTPPALESDKQMMQRNKKEDNSPSSNRKGGLFSPSQMEELPPPAQPEPEKRGFMSRFFRRSSNEPTAAQTKEQVAQKNDGPEKKIGAKPVRNVDEFIPDEGPVDDFLNEIPEAKERPTGNTLDSSDEDENAGNPMVAGFQEDLDSDDQVGPSFNQRTYSSSESESEAPKSVKHPPKSNVTNALKSTTFNEVSQDPPSSLNFTETINAQETSDSEGDAHRPEITPDADLTSDDNIFPNTPNFAMMTTKKIKDQETKSWGNSEKVTDVVSAKLKTPREIVQNDSESDGDTKPNTMVSTAYDDISSNDESAPQPPIAIVTPLQAEPQFSLDIEEELDFKPNAAGLSLELSSSDLNFLEHTSKQKSPPNERRSSKDARSQRSKKPSSRRSEEDGSAAKKSHRKHKKHRSKDGEEHLRNEEGKTHRTKEDRERRKKKRSSREPEQPPKSDKVDDDLEAFLSGC